MLYSVVDLRFCVFNKIDNYTEVLVEVFLSKPLMGDFLTQFLPTALFLMIRQAAIIFIIQLLTNFAFLFLVKPSSYFLMSTLTWWLQSTSPSSWSWPPCKYKPAWSTLIGPGMSHCWWRQLSYAIKNQLKASKAPFGTQRPNGSLLAPRWFFMA